MWNFTAKVEEILDEVGESDEQECLVYKRKVEQAAKSRAKLLQTLSDANAELSRKRGCTRFLSL